MIKDRDISENSDSVVITMMERSEVMVIVIVISIVATVTARVDTVHPNDYLTLDIDCKDHMIKVRIRAVPIHVIIMMEIKLETEQFLISDSHTNFGPFLWRGVRTA